MAVDKETLWDRVVEKTFLTLWFIAVMFRILQHVLFSAVGMIVLSVVVLGAVAVLFSVMT